VAADGVDGMEGWCERDDDVSKSSEVKLLFILKTSSSHGKAERVRIGSDDRQRA
jgi:hypothetical protein